MTYEVFTIVLLFPLACQGWVTLTAPTPKLVFHDVLRFMEMPGEMEQFDASPEFDVSPEFDTENPCWQSIYDDDCAMEYAAAAHYKAIEWIKSMPCGQGIKDCDFPEETTIPELRPHADVDVMEFLGLKRASKIDTAGKEEQSKP